MGALQRGFKTWAERTAAALRRELGLSDIAPLQVARLADFLEVRLWTPSDVPGLSKAMRDQLLVHDPEGWSAVACTFDGRNTIIHNPSHSLGRQASNIAHELSHIILDHEPGQIVLSQDGSMIMRSYDQKQEEEANWLGWCLLLPRAALVQTEKSRLSAAQIAERYGVSEQLVKYRVGVTGITSQFRRQRPSLVSR